MNGDRIEQPKGIEDCSSKEFVLLQKDILYKI
jgi:hypothetical protein